MKKNLKILAPDPAAVERIRKHLSCTSILAAILVNRNISSPEAADRFLKCTLNDLRHPAAVRDLETAAARIRSALARREKILIFGDYDVDGITATAILLEFLRDAGGEVSYYIPHRIEEGYSIQPNHIRDYAAPRDIRLIITVDCGSSAHEAVRSAREAGIDVVITDHHRLPDTLPPACAVVNPNRKDCMSGLGSLSGVGVAFYLLISLRRCLRESGFWKGRQEPNLKKLCDLVALGTVADMVPMVEENRIFAQTGLFLMNSGNRDGIKALAETCGAGKSVLSAEDIAFRLAPRLNAAGRIGHAASAVELLTAKDIGAARGIACSLQQLNAKRQDIEKRMIDQIFSYLENHPEELAENSLVLSGEDWHPGILGIVASRLVEKYYRPVVLVSLEDGTARGSARSIPGFDLYQGLRVCGDCLEAFGGHAMAAGLRISPCKLPRFRRSFSDAIRRMTTPEDFVSILTIDCEIDLAEISDRLADELETLQPFGAGNCEPLFLARGVEVVNATLVGGCHRRMTLRQAAPPGGKTFSAIQFKVDPQARVQNFFDSLAFRLRWNRWNGKKEIQLLVASG